MPQRQEVEEWTGIGREREKSSVELGIIFAISLYNRIASTFFSPPSVDDDISHSWAPPEHNNELGFTVSLYIIPVAMINVSI